MASKQQRATRKARQHNASVYRQGSKAIRAMVRAIADARLGLMEELSHATSEWQQRHIQQAMAELDKGMREYRLVARSLMDPSLRHAGQAGLEVVKDAIAIRGSLSVRPLQVLTPQFLQAASTHSAFLILDISADTLQAVNRILRRAALQQTPVTEVMRQIAPEVGRGVFRSAELRSEFVARTEMTRTMSTSSQASMSDLAARGYLDRKQWIAAIDSRTRGDHIDANEQLAGVEDTYKVGGYALMYPGDASAPAEQTVNCRCVSVPFVTA